MKISVFHEEIGGVPKNDILTVLKVCRLSCPTGRVFDGITFNKFPFIALLVRKQDPSQRGISSAGC